MYKCEKCGAEFEGNFCPECGTKRADQKTCPSCGASVPSGARFCNECGYSFASGGERSAPAKAQSAGINVAARKTAIKILSFVPVVFAALLGVLLLVFCSSPVAVITDELFGEKISLGSVYSMLDNGTVEGTNIKAWLILMVVVAALTLALGVLLTIVTAVKKDMRNGRSATGMKFAVFGGGLLCAANVLATAMVMNEISELDEGMGLIQSGNALTLILSFSIVYAAVAAVAFAVQTVLKHNREFAAALEAERKEYEAKESVRRKEYYATHTAPVAPDRYKLSTGTYKTEAVRYKHAKRRYDNAQEGETPAAVLWLDRNKAPLISVAAVLAVALAAVFVALYVVIPIMNDIFRINKVEGIELGSNAAQVSSVLGEKHYGNDSVWYYVDGDARATMDSIADNERRQQEAMEQGELGDVFELENSRQKLLASLEKMTYKFIMVKFDDGLVTEVLFDTRHKYSPNDDYATMGKVLKTVTGPTVDYYEDFRTHERTYCSVYIDDYAAYFSDGSYYMTAAKNAVINSENNEYSISWSDRFAEYSIENKTLNDLGNDGSTKKELIGTIDEDGVWNTPWNANNKDIISFTIPDGVTAVGERAFYGCSSLTNVRIPSSVVAIGKRAFYDCRSLQTVTIEAGSRLETIEESAFYDCYNLTSIDIPSSVVAIGKRAFYGCRSLQTVTIEAGSRLETIEESAFYDCYNLTSIDIPNSVTFIDGAAFYGCNSLTKVNYTGDLASWCKIGFGSGSANPLHCGAELYIMGVKQTEVVIPQEVTEIKDYAFYGCKSITSVNIHDGVTCIGNCAFEGCNSLQPSETENSAEYLGNTDNPYMYLWRVADKHITICTINAKTKIIGNEAFVKNRSLSKVEIPGSVTAIGDGAFRYCSSLQTVRFDSDSRLETIGANAFDSCISLMSINIPIDVTSIGGSAFEDCRSLESIEIPSSVAFIGYGAFDYCYNLTSVVFEDTVGWKAGHILLDSTELAKPEVAAEYLRDTYNHYKWTKSK